MLGLFIVVPAITFNAIGAAIWNKPTSGLWRDTNNWSTGKAPNLGLGGTYITNASTKTVTIDALTPVTNLFINSLNVWAPTNTTNTLLLSDVGTNSPLVVSNATLTVARGGSIVVTNSSLVVTGRNISFNVWAGSVTLDSGSIIAREEPLTTNVTVMTRIGRTNAASLNINGGFMHATTMQVGETPGLQFGRSQGTVRLSGGTLSIAGEFSIGSSLFCTGTVAMTGGQLIVANNLTNIMRIGDEGTGTMTVSNAAVSVGDVSVGRHDSSVGTLVLSSGGLFGGSDDLSIGRFSGATGMVYVAGGQMLITNHPIWVGREGIGQLIVSNGLVQAQGIQVAVVPTNTAHGSALLAGGSVLVSSNFSVGEGLLSTGEVFVAGTSLVITNSDHTAYLQIARGSVTLSSGAVSADKVYLTNSTGRFVFNGGTLQTKGTIASNGAPFVVGDGTNAATLNLAGGTHLFTAGLILSSNATLTGCGTIIGSVVNHGTIATNCSAAPPPTITRITFGTNTAAVFFQSVGGATYFLEYKDRLQDSSWTPVASATGSGSLLQLTDPAATARMRFYRIRVQ